MLAKLRKTILRFFKLSGVDEGRNLTKTRLGGFGPNPGTKDVSQEYVRVATMRCRHPSRSVWMQCIQPDYLPFFDPSNYLRAVRRKNELNLREATNQRWNDLSLPVRVQV